MRFTKDFKNGFKVHGIQTGTVAVKREHYQYSGLGGLRFPMILFGKKWKPDMPIWTWLIETPTGNYLIDTGETAEYYNEDHFKDNKGDDYVNRKILDIKIKEAEQLDFQLEELGFSTNDIDAVIFTHLHLDHIDGIRYLSNAEFICNELELEKPFGVPFSVIPKWFQPKKIKHEKTNLPFKGSFQLTKNISLVSTPGHTFGHQSVLLEMDNTHILFAGDTTFTQEQLIKGKIGGINIDIKQSKETLNKIKILAKETDLVYLPSHDFDSQNRLLNMEFVGNVEK